MKLAGLGLRHRLGIFAARHRQHHARQAGSCCCREGVRIGLSTGTPASDRATRPGAGSCRQCATAAIAGAPVFVSARRPALQQRPQAARTAAERAPRGARRAGRVAGGTGAATGAGSTAAITGAAWPALLRVRAQGREPWSADRTAWVYSRTKRPLGPGDVRITSTEAPARRDRWSPAPGKTGHRRGAAVPRWWPAARRCSHAGGAVAPPA